MPRAEPPRPARLSPLFLLAVLIGIAARILALLKKPLWADETFTLWLSRRSVPFIFQSLHVDSGPPLHYLLAKLVLLPFPGAGHGDVAVRLLSLAASLLHFPLLLAVGRRLGDARLGTRAAVLFALFPLAIDFAAEGRAYAVASLLVLCALERALALCERPSGRDALLLALAGGAAALTHYLAVVPVAALALLVPRAKGRGALAAGLGGAALLFAPWLPVLALQPRASMAWTNAASPLDTLGRFLANLAFGTDPAGRLVLPLAILGFLTLAVAVVRAPRLLSGPLAGAVALLFLLQSATGAALLPQRSALPILPLAVLAIASVPSASLVASAVAVGALVTRLAAPPSVSPGTELADALLPLAKRGAVICAPGLWGPDLDYRLSAGGAIGRVVLFPSELARHRGWYDDAAASPTALDLEARTLVERSRARVYVVPVAGNAAGALTRALEGRKTRSLGKTPLFEIRALERP